MFYFLCPTCGTLLADKEIPFTKRFNEINGNDNLNNDQKNKEVKKLLDSMSITNICCRARCLCHVDETKIVHRPVNTYRTI